MDITNQKQELAARAAMLYYENQQSQNQIAGQLGISRSYVSQLLTYARESGLVEINVNIKSEYKIESEFVKKTNLKYAYILHSDSSGFTEKNIGRFAAPHITRLIKNAKNIGINLGESVLKAISELDSNDFQDSIKRVVIQLMGGYNNSINTSSLPNELVNKLGMTLNSRCMYLNCPVVVESKELRDLILKEQSIKTVTDYWDKIDLAIMGIGVADERSKTFSMLSAHMKERIKNEKACCDININYFNKDGEFLNLLEESKIGIPYKQLQKTDNKVVIGFGSNKAEAIATGLRANMIDILITDSITAIEIEKLM